jgi:hypothetical protein
MQSGQCDIPLSIKELPGHGRQGRKRRRRGKLGAQTESEEEAAKLSLREKREETYKIYIL